MRCDDVARLLPAARTGSIAACASGGQGVAHSAAAASSAAPGI